MKIVYFLAITSIGENRIKVPNNEIYYPRVLNMLYLYMQEF